jgi:hypothetical protein
MKMYGVVEAYLHAFSTLVSRPVNGTPWRKILRYVLDRGARGSIIG